MDHDQHGRPVVKPTTTARLEAIADELETAADKYPSVDQLFDQVLRVATDRQAAQIWARIPAAEKHRIATEVFPGLTIEAVEQLWELEGRTITDEQRPWYVERVRFMQARLLFCFESEAPL